MDTFAVDVRVSEVPVELTGEKDPVVQVVIRSATKSDVSIKTNMYHETNVTKLEFERANAVFELMTELS